MTVLHVSGAKVWGGNERQLMYLLDELPGHSVKQKLLCYKDTPLFNEAQNHPVEIITLPQCKPYSAEYRKFFRDTVKSEGVDVIHLHTSDSVTGYVLTDLFYALETPTVFAKKGVRSKTSFLSKQKYNYKNIDKIICISEYVKKHFGKILSTKNREKLVTVYNGVKLETEKKEADFQLRDKLGISEKSFLIGNIANHTNAKDLPTFIKMIEFLVKNLQERDVHVVQIGEFSGNTQKLKEMVKELDLEDYFSFMGFVENASSYLPQFDVFVMTSEREGGPSSVVEAFYNQTPVISTRVGVVEEVIEDGINGFSAPVKDYKGLAERIQKLKRNPELSIEFGKRSHQVYLKRFRAEILGKSTYQVYRDMVN